MDWQPIATAPKDRRVLLGAPSVVREGEWWEAYGGMWSVDFSPTHWMPLPEPPL